MSFTETFDGVTAPAVPGGWIWNPNFATSSALTGGLSPTSAPNALLLSTIGSINCGGTYGTPDANGGDVVVRANFSYAAGGSIAQAFAVLARGSSNDLFTGSNTYYQAVLATSSATLQIGKVVAGTPTLLGSAVSITGLAHSVWYQVAFSLASTALAVTVQRLSDGFWLNSGGTFQAGAATAISLTDASISGSGYAGLLMQSRSVNAYTDDWFFDNASPPPPPPPPPKSAPLHLPGPWTPPDPWAWIPPSIPATNFPGPMRPGIVAMPTLRAPAPVEDPAPLGWLPRAIPSGGTPAPRAIGPPGSSRVVVAAAEEWPPRTSLPSPIPSPGTPTRPAIMPPGPSRAVVGAADDIPARAWMPIGLPSAGVPASTGPGLMVPPSRIVTSWAAGGDLGGGGLLGGVPGENAGNWSGDSGLAPWGAGAASSDGAPFLLGGWASNGPDGMLSGPMAVGVAPAPPGGGGGGTFRLGSIGCCCGPTRICVVACGGIPVVGATVNAYLAGVLVATCTTDATGCCPLDLSGSYLIQVVVSGTVVSSATRTLSGGTITIALGGNAGLVCCGGYAIPQALTLTDAIGTISFVYDPNTFFPTWYGGHSATQSSCTVTTPNNICVAAAPSVGPVRVCYQMICFAGQNPAFAIQRSWSWVYQPGTLTPIWYQDPSGFVPGQPCTTGPPAMCGSPHTDVATDSENPTSTTPFAITFHPAPAVSNYTSDPIGGDVTITP